MFSFRIVSGKNCANHKYIIYFRDVNGISFIF